MTDELLAIAGERFGTIARATLRDAQAELRRMVGDEGELTPLFDGQDERPWDSLSDVASSLGRIFGGAAAASAVPAAAITTTAGFLGFGAATVVSWPVIVGGGAIAGTAVATGLIRTAKLKSRRADAFLARLNDRVARAVFSRDPEHSSLLSRVEAAIEATASPLLESTPS